MKNVKHEKLVRLGDYAIGDGDHNLVARGLGSCVAVMLHDADAKVGALAHVLLPSHSLTRAEHQPARAADTAIPFLAGQVWAAGAKRERTVAKLVGGASMFAELLAASVVHMGERNIVACRLALRRAGIPIVAQALGGQKSRSVWFDPATGSVSIRSVGQDPITL